jgi:hypothetical protein
MVLTLNERAAADKMAGAALIKRGEDTDYVDHSPGR